MKKNFLLIFFFLLFISLLTQEVNAGLVPCGLMEDDPNLPGDQTRACTLCDLFALFVNVVNFIFVDVVPPLAALMVAIAGFFFGFSYLNPAGGGPETINQAKKILTSVAVALLIVYGAWLLVNTFFIFIGVAEWTNLKGGWFQINCE